MHLFKKTMYKFQALTGIVGSNSKPGFMTPYSLYAYFISLVILGNTCFGLGHDFLSTGHDFFSTKYIHHGSHTFSETKFKDFLTTFHGQNYIFQALWNGYLAYCRCIILWWNNLPYIKLKYSQFIFQLYHVYTQRQRILYKKRLIW